MRSFIKKNKIKNNPYHVTLFSRLGQGGEPGHHDGPHAPRRLGDLASGQPQEGARHARENQGRVSSACLLSV